MCRGEVTWGVHVAHLRAGSLEHGKRETGMQEKPSDRFCLPLCPPHHVGDKRKVSVTQHAMGEVEFWSQVGIPDPFQVCEDLSDAYDAGANGQGVIGRHAAAARRTAWTA
jgi:hypothetical protein